ncbi:MAG: hypothetical protein JSV33_05690 [bacterium]|nr:MAG: hypothetical protein JSV33_05690 [bacterium]
MKSENGARSLVSLIFFIVFLSFLCSSVFAGESGKENVRENSLHPGSWSLQFQIEDDLVLKKFGGMIISVKRHLSRHSAFRVGLDLDIEFDDETREDITEVADTIASRREITAEASRQTVQLDFLYMNYPRPDANINLFWGAGPLFKIQRSKKKTQNILVSGGPPGDTKMYSYLLSWSIGVLGIGGVEWFATKNISFHAEYRASLVYTNGEIDNSRTTYGTDVRKQRDIRDYDEWRFDGLSVIMGISVYF